MTLVILLTSVRPYQGLSKTNVSMVIDKISSLRGGLTKNFMPRSFSEAVRRSYFDLYPLFPFFFLFFLSNLCFFVLFPFFIFLFIITPVFFVSTIVSIILDLDNDSGDGEDAAKIRSEGSSGFLSSVMRYLPADSKISRWNPSSVTRFSERFAMRLHNYRPFAAKLR